MLKGMNFKDFMKWARKEHGMTQADLAEAVGVSDEAVSFWETGKRNITLENAKAVLAVFGYRFEIVEDKA